MVEQTSTNEEKEELLSTTREQIMDWYYLKYQHDHSLVIGDNKLKRNVEVMTGKQALYCTFHDTRNTEYECEHIRFIKMLIGRQN